MLNNVSKNRGPVRLDIYGQEDLRTPLSLIFSIDLFFNSLARWCSVFFSIIAALIILYYRKYTEFYMVWGFHYNVVVICLITFVILYWSWRILDDFNYDQSRFFYFYKVFDLCLSLFFIFGCIFSLILFFKVQHELEATHWDRILCRPLLFDEHGSLFFVKKYYNEEDRHGLVWGPFFSIGREYTMKELHDVFIELSLEKLRAHGDPQLLALFIKLVEATPRSTFKLMWLVERTKKPRLADFEWMSRMKLVRFLASDIVNLLSVICAEPRPKPVRYRNFITKYFWTQLEFQLGRLGAYLHHVRDAIFPRRIFVVKRYKYNSPPKRKVGNVGKSQKKK